MTMVSHWGHEHFILFGVQTFASDYNLVVMREVTVLNWGIMFPVRCTSKQGYYGLIYEKGWGFVYGEV